MREILFRGRRLDNGEWVEGYYGKTHFRSGIGSVIYVHDECCTTTVRVDPATVGQWTGLVVKDKVRLFEGHNCTIQYEALDHEKYESEAVVKWDHEDSGFFFETDNDKWPHVKPWFVTSCTIHDTEAP